MDMLKSLILLTFLILLSSVSPCASYYVQGDTYVYICTGAKAYSYHCNRGCRGLNQCKAEIKKVSITYAKSIKRSPCRICYK